MIKKLLHSFVFTIVLCSASLCLYSQDKYSNINFSEVDSFARTVKYENDLIKLTNTLTAGYFDRILKFRSIFIWITDNIKYDYKFVNKGKEILPPQCDNKIDCANELREWENSYIKKVLNKKKGVCDGYARLLKKMCELAEIECEIVPGYIKQKPYQVGIPLSVSHAWNAVKLDSTYYFVDATWAAGYCVEDEDKGVLLSYQKNYNNYYWLTPFEKLVRNHYPKEGKWVVKDNYTKEKFLNTPYYAGNVLPKIELISPTTGMLEYKKGDTVRFSFNYSGNIKKIQVNSNGYRNPSIFKHTKVSRSKTIREIDTIALKKQVYIPFTKEGPLHSFEYVIKDNATYYLEVLFDYRTVLRFKNNSEKKR